MIVGFDFTITSALDSNILKRWFKNKGFLYRKFYSHKINKTYKISS